MRDLAASGCGVVHLRAVEYAEQHRVPLVVRSSFHDGPGTVIGPGAAAAPAGRRPVPVPPTAACDRDVALPSAGDARAARTRPACAWPRPTRPKACACGTRCWAAGIPPARWPSGWTPGPDFRWEVVAAAAALAPVREVLAALAPAAVAWEDGLTCVSLAGGRPDSWLEVQRHVAGLLAGLDTPPWRLRADGSALRILFSGELTPAAPPALHAALVRD